MTSTDFIINMDTKVCFCAIFRNESKNVYRCLNAAKPVISYISICDTGSEDNTIELIEQWGLEHNIPTKVHREEFKNFGYNRTLSVKLARESFPEADYILLIDADMVLQVKKGWKDELFQCDKAGYLMMQKTPAISYWNTRLVSTKHEWDCVGVTHEYWDIVQDPESENNINYKNNKIKNIWIDDRNDGGHKADKFERDARLLEKGLKDDSIDDGLRGRYMFYLAQTYRDMHKNEESIKWYKERVEHGGWNEEIFFSKMQIGILYERLDEYETAAGHYLDAWDHRPTRAESLHFLSKMYRLQGKNSLAYTFAKLGKEIKYPGNDLLFVDHNVYLYKLDEEISISAYYVEKKDEGKTSAAKLISLEGQIPESTYKLALSNIKYYD